jgi:hypothetical protein
LSRKDEIKTVLVAAFTIIGTGAQMTPMIVTGTTLQVRAEQGADALIEAAQANVALASFLLGMLKAGHYGPLVMFAATMLLAASIDVGVVPPLSPPAQFALGDVLSRFTFAQAATPPPSPNGHAATEDVATGAASV